MSEQRRQEYLEALGIDQFVPRKSLSAAKPSLALVRQQQIAHAGNAQPIDGVEQAVITGDTGSDAKTEATAPALRQRTELEGEQPSTAAPQAAADLVDSVARRLGEKPQVTAKAETQVTGLVPVQRVLRFALTIWHLPGWLWIDSRQSQEALPTDALLHNILHALGLNTPVKAEVINWPPVESPIQNQDWPQAREMLKSFLAPRLAAGERLILLGEAAYNACTDGPFDYQERVISGAVLPQIHNSCLLLPSLAHILRKPTLKAQVWQQLQQFKSAI